LDMVKRQLANVESNIARHQKMIKALSASGKDLGRARELLAEMENALELYQKRLLELLAASRESMDEKENRDG